MRERASSDNSDICLKALEILYCDGEWYRLPKILHKILPDGKPLKDAAFTLAAMLNQSTAQKAIAKKAGWFTFCEKKTEEDTGFNRRRQTFHIKLLEDVKLIKRRRAKRIFGNRQIQIDFHLLISLMEEVSQDQPHEADDNHLRKNCASASEETAQADVLKLRNSYRKKEQKEKKRKSAAHSARETPSHPSGENGKSRSNGKLRGFDEENGKSRSFGEICAKRLFDFLVAQRSISPRIPTKTWATHFRNLLERRTEEEITAALDWYCDRDHYRDRWTPKCDSARTFCERIAKVEEARERILLDRWEEVPVDLPPERIKVKNPDGSFRLETTVTTVKRYRKLKRDDSGRLVLDESDQKLYTNPF